MTLSESLDYLKSKGVHVEAPWYNQETLRQCALIMRDQQIALDDAIAELQEVWKGARRRVTPLRLVKQ